ncbi:MAG: hypothetical protein EAZ55_06865 [Cytophagales bacterium]|nr:MAG: hypothetical protein EAZ55_06865 [Cytophagales bacterium]
MKRKIIFSLSLSILLIFAAKHTTAQNTYEKFGKNRVQYKKFYWKNYKTENFDIYFYDGGVRLAQFAGRFLETEFDKITDLLGYTPYNRSKIFIYNSVGDMQQSNIGLDKEHIHTGGQTNFFNSQAEIPYTGAIEEFKKELLYGVSYMLINEMMYGGSLKDMLQSTYSNAFSDWFIGGAAAYVAEEWSQDMDDYMRDMFKRKKKVKKPNLLIDQEAIFAGQSVWSFIAQKYGENNISNILNLARIIRNERQSISSTLGVRYPQFIRQWQSYYEEITNLTLEKAEDAIFDKKLKNSSPKVNAYSDIKISPDGNWAAYSVNKSGRYKIYLQNLTNYRKKTLFTSGYHAIYQRPDLSYPFLAWQNNDNIALMYHKKGTAKMRIYNTHKKMQFEKIWASVNQIKGFDISDDGNFFIFSADAKGQSDSKTAQNDLFIYDQELDYVEQITDDWHDDLYPQFLTNSSKAFVFSSNRMDDTLRVDGFDDRGPYDKDWGTYDLFVYNPEKSKNSLERIAYSADGNEIRPTILDNENIVYLNDESGIYQLYRYNTTTAQNVPITQYRQSVLNYDINNYNGNTSLACFMIRRGRIYPYYKKTTDFMQQANAFKTPRAELLAGKYQQNKIIRPEKIIIDSLKIDSISTQVNTLKPDEVDTDNYSFDPDVLKEQQIEQQNQTTSKIQSTLLNNIKNANKKEIKIMGSYDYEPRFRTEGITTSFFMDPLRGFSVVLNLNTSDLLENHKIRAGLMGVLDLRQASYYAEYQFLGHRLDYTFRYERNSIYLNSSEELIQRYVLDKLEFTVSYPLTNLMRVSVSPFYVTTQFTNIARPFIAQPQQRINYVGVRAEWVFDNTRINGMNLIRGTRAKAMFENYNALSDAPESFNHLLLDLRNYFKIHRDIVFATRLSYGQFSGNAPKRYVLGGMDNWLGAQTSNTGENDALATAPDQNNTNLLFLRYVTNMRGFDYNKMSGSQFLLANFEFRLPLVKYLFGKRINNNFLKNLQFVSFFDIGTAWTDGSPFARENSTNTRNITQTSVPFNATVTNFKNPFLAGYGLGARTMLLGYYMKLDVAWGIEDYNISKDAKFYLTFGYDF